MFYADDRSRALKEGDVVGNLILLLLCAATGQTVV